MLFAYSSLFSSVFLASLLSPSLATPKLEARQNCAASYTQCAPKGATSTNIPAIGPDLAPLYVDLVNSVQGIKNKRDEARVKSRDDAMNICCADGTNCLVLQGLSVPFCYDRFTTNFFLPSNAYGSIIQGTYNAPDGSTASLISGNYTLTGGRTGNIYGAAADAPNTATLALPTPYTSAGVGSAIPATALGQVVTYTTTIAGSTIPATTVAGQTTTEVVVVGGSTIAPSSAPALETVVGGTTVAASVSASAASVSASATVLGGTTVTERAQGSQTASPSVVGGTTTSVVSVLAPSTLAATTVPAMVLTVTSHVAAAPTSGAAGRDEGADIFGMGKLVGMVVLGVLAM